MGPPRTNSLGSRLANKHKKQEKDLLLQVTTSAVPELTDEANRLYYQVLWPPGVVTRSRNGAQPAQKRKWHPGTLWQWIVAKTTAIVSAEEQPEQKQKLNQMKLKGTKGGAPAQDKQIRQERSPHIRADVWVTTFPH